MLLSPGLQCADRLRRLGGWLLLLLLGTGGGVMAQELEPGAYLAGPAGMHAFASALTYSAGDVAIDASSPIDDMDAEIMTSAVSYLQTFGLAGRLSSVGVAVPYVVADVKGTYQGEPEAVVRRGVGDPRFRFTMNLRGIPAMAPLKFAQYKPDWVLGTSLVVIPPLGKYDSTKLINVGTNRWSFKPEIGFTKTAGRWTWEGAAGVWFFTDNTNYFNGGVREQEAIGSYQAHVRYTFESGRWLALSANYFTGGRTTLNGQKRFDLQKNSRVGLTYTVPLKPGHSLRFAYSTGARTTIGADFTFAGISYVFAMPTKRAMPPRPAAHQARPNDTIRW